MVQRIDDDTIEIIDYKSNRSLYSQEALDSYFQLSAYALVARELYPWARNIRLSFAMLRYDVSQKVTRMSAQIDSARDYIVALGRRTESDTEWKATLNPKWRYRDSRIRCDTFKKAVEGKHEYTKAKGKTDIDQVSHEFEAVTKVAKAAYSKARDLEKVLRAHMERVGEFGANGHHYRLDPQYATVYGLETVLNVFEQAGIGKEEQAKMLTVESAAVGKMTE